MSSILKKPSADKMAFTHNPKAFRIATSEVAKDFVSLQGKKVSDFKLAEVVAQQTGVEALRRKNIEAQVESTVLDRLKEIEEQAYKQAYELGLIDGTEKAFEEKRVYFAEKLTRLDQMLAAFDSIKTEILKENEATLMKLIFQIANRIAMREISLSQEPIVAMLNDLVGGLQGDDSVTIRLNPEDLNFVETLRQKNVKATEDLQRVKFVASPDIAKGGCLLETIYGTIDSTIAQRVEKAWASIESKLPVLDKDDKK
jgi:flagellar assembly protein FliH